MEEISTPGAVSPIKPRVGGGKLVFEDRRLASRLYRGRIEGQAITQERLFTPMSAESEYVRFSLEGARIAWSQPDGIWISGPETARRKVVDLCTDKRDVEWSPDGRHIAVTAQHGQDWRIWIVAVSSGEMKRLTKDQASEG